MPEQIELDISVYMPTHKRADMMVRAIESVYAQSVKIREMIVVDDGSGDDTWNTLQSLKSRFPSLKTLQHSSPRGACAARNSAIFAAEGEFITGIDDDDEWLPDHLAQLSAHWNERYAGVFASMLNDTGGSRVPQGKEYGRFSLASVLHYNRLGNQVFTLTSRMQSIGGFDESLPAFQDYDCWVRLLEAFGPALKTQDHSYVLHTAHEAGRISGNNQKRLRALDMFIEKHSDKMSAAHAQSMTLLRSRIEGARLGIFTLLRLVNAGNVRAVLATLRGQMKGQS